MATITVEDGSLVAGANSYCTTAELDTYASIGNVTLSGTYGDQSQVLLQAMRYIESLNFQGEVYTSTQALVWPRSGVYIDGYAVDSDEIPQLLKNAHMAAAIAIDLGIGPLSNISRAIKKVKADVVEIEYADNAAPVVVLRELQTFLAKLLRPGAGGNNFAVTR